MSDEIRDILDSAVFVTIVSVIVALCASLLVGIVGFRAGQLAALRSTVSAQEQFYRGMYALCIDIVMGQQTTPTFSVAVATCKLEVEKAKANNDFDAETPGWK